MARFQPYSPGVMGCNVLLALMFTMYTQNMLYLQQHNTD